MRSLLILPLLTLITACGGSPPAEAPPAPQADPPKPQAKSRLRPSEPLPIEKGTMPKAVSGFAFGASRAEIGGACDKAGHQVVDTVRGKPVRGDIKELYSMICTGEAVETAYKPLFVMLTFCKSGGMCEASLFISRDGDELKPDSQQQTYDEALGVLTKKYGRPTEQEKVQPVLPLWKQCVGDKRDVNMRQFWSWPITEGQIILYYACKGATGNGSGSTGVIYQSAEMRIARLGEYIEKEENY